MPRLSSPRQAQLRGICFTLEPLPLQFNLTRLVVGQTRLVLDLRSPRLPTCHRSALIACFLASCSCSAPSNARSRRCSRPDPAHTKSANGYSDYRSPGRACVPVLLRMCLHPRMSERPGWISFSISRLVPDTSAPPPAHAPSCAPPLPVAIPVSIGCSSTSAYGVM
ncbi:hypothetical protein B0H13DRAFT_2342228 [Mycena leptocephala]|nr:hypothetical protein B0H13DRAFT_2342228 [Mycena leptocephala]